MNSQKVLIIAAHPDDEVLGCGGTIARLSQEGCEVYVAILGEGITSRSARREFADQGLVESLHATSHTVAELLGAQRLFMYGLPDNRFDTVPLLDIVKIIGELIEQISPQTIFTQHGGDLNIDHVIVYRATLTATRPMTGASVKAVYAYEVSSSTEWSFQQFSPVFHPNLFIDITQSLERKVQAMQIYETEIRSFPHPRSAEALRANAHRWGSAVGLAAAEAFQVVREIR